MTAEERDVVVVGAGAAGLATAIFSAEYDQGLSEESATRRRPIRVTVLEGAPRIGAKILVSGGGRCNVTHFEVSTSDYHGGRNFIKRVLRGFPVVETVDWFASLGVDLKREETGKLFPTSNRARTVVDALVGRAEELGVELRVGERVSAIDRHPNGGFRIHHGATTTDCQRVVLATGGRSLPKSGSDGTGYLLAKELGHTVTETWQALVPLLLDESFPHASLSGISHRARLTIRIDEKKFEERMGDLLWTHFGISGPVAMDVSRSWIAGQESEKSSTLELSFLPDRTWTDLEEEIVEVGRKHPRRTLATWLSSQLPKRVGFEIARLSEIEESHTISQLPKAARRALLKTLTELTLPVIAPRGWNQAEVTAGGIPLDEVRSATLESRQVPHLFLVGEILDVDGRIGGFNFQWAWATGRTAGKAIARSFRETPAEKPR